jgi:hypothetical protein
MTAVNNNTTSKYPTNFLRGVELINEAHGKYNLLSENWTYPTKYTFGSPKDYYYAEIWQDGMDWTYNYWLIETVNLEKPQVYPAIYFSDNSQRDKYNEHDFEELLMAIMSYRRDITWFKESNLMTKFFYYNHAWPFIRQVEPLDFLKKCPCMIKHRALHGSQPKVEFYLNTNLIPQQQPVSNKVTAEGMTIESEYPIEEKLIRDEPTLRPDIIKRDGENTLGGNNQEDPF